MNINHYKCIKWKGKVSKRMVNWIINLRIEIFPGHLWASKVGWGTWQATTSDGTHKVSVVRRGVYEKGAIGRRIGDGEKKLPPRNHPRLHLASWQNSYHLKSKSEERYSAFSTMTLRSPSFSSSPKTTVTASPSIWARHSMQTLSPFFLHQILPQQPNHRCLPLQIWHCKISVM